MSAAMLCTSVATPRHRAQLPSCAAVETRQVHAMGASFNIAHARAKAVITARFDSVDAIYRSSPALKGIVNPGAQGALQAQVPAVTTRGCATSPQMASSHKHRHI
jgi:hypothetical protein